MTNLKKQKRDFVSIYEKRMAAFPYLYGEPGTSDAGFKKSVGCKHSLIIETFEDGFACWHFSTSEWQRMAESILEKLFNGKLKTRTYFTKVSSYGQKSLKFLNQIIPKFPKATKKELRKIFVEYFDLQFQVVSWGDPISLTTDQASIKKLDGLLKDSVKDFNQRQEILSQLITLERPSFAMREECELINLVAQNNFKGLKEYESKWKHLAFDYIGPITTYKEFRKRFNNLKKEDFAQKQKFCQNYTNEVKNQKKTIIKKYRLSKEAQKLSKIITQTNEIYDLRKSYLTKMSFEFSKVLDEIARVTKIQREWLNWLFGEEILDLLDNKFKPTASQIKARQKNGMAVYENGKARFLKDNEKLKYLALIAEKKITKDVKSFSGQVGSPGIASGRVNLILSATHANRMKRGDVLVAPMTSVDFLPAMRQASAIVTDVGGITSHAAVVSRELGIPCIIGTKIATKVLKDGDLVEVDANKGVVRKIG